MAEMTDRECVLAMSAELYKTATYSQRLDAAEALLREQVARAIAKRDAEIARLTAEVAGLRDGLKSLMLTANEVKVINTPEFMEWLILRTAQARNLLNAKGGAR